MNRLRFIGQILLWAGFLSAAIASCAQKEFDFLPESERSSLSKLTSGVTISKADLAEFADREIKTLSDEELAAICTRLEPVLQQRDDEKKKRADLTGVDITELTAKQLDEYAKFVLPMLRAEALQKAIDEELKKSSTGDEQNVEITKKSYKKKDFISGRTSLIENKWVTVNWIWYLASMAVGIGGVVLLRRTSKSAITESGRVAEEFSAVTESLALLRQHARYLASNLQDMPPQDIVNFIDDNFSKPFAEFADARNSLIQRFGMQSFAEIMTQFASGERFMNRAWSAAADGYINEVKDCVQRADAHLTRTDEILTSYEKSQ